MQLRVRALVKDLLLRTGHYRRRLMRDSFGAVAVLCYHGIRRGISPDYGVCFAGLHVTVGEFESHCRLIREVCHPISLDQWRESLNGGPSLPPRPVLMTFDDGYRSVFSLARPILQKYGIPAIVFVCSDPVENQELLWYDAAARSLGEAEVEAMAKLPYAEWQKAAAKLDKKVCNDDPNAPLTVEELKMLSAIPGIEIGGHTSTHVRLTMANNEEQLEQVFRNKKALEQWIGLTIRAFAYPNGLPGEDYDNSSVSVVHDAGYEFAFTTVQSYAPRDGTHLETPRFLIMAGASPSELAHRFTYSWRRGEFDSVT
jgi:peptidoglycan/xylan/chitin deacetylase (PgdA/CDA1 family)